MAGKGKPFVLGKSGNPIGRPVGARNKTTLAVEALFDGEAEALTRKVVEMDCASRDWSACLVTAATTGNRGYPGSMPRDAFVHRSPR